MVYSFAVSYRKVKPMPHEKVFRNEMIVKMHTEHPELTLEEIGKNFDITKQRVQVILKTFSPKPVEVADGNK